jgi:tryptophan synthase alpha chain
LAGYFADLKAQNRKAVVAYIVAGDPMPEMTLPLMLALVDAGIDVIEVGVPFSDPMSEGPIIQRAHERALSHHTSIHNALEVVAQFRQQNQTTPIVLMGYANPIERTGYERFTKECVQAGVDGLITVDLPPEEVGPLNEHLRAAGMDNIFLISPTTPEPRVGHICALASGFIYYVALKGVTGAGNLDVAEVAANLERVRRHTDLPLAVGFGIKDRHSAAAIARVADGVVVGSALVDIIDRTMSTGGSQEEALGAAADLVAEIRAGVDELSQ